MKRKCNWLVITTSNVEMKFLCVWYPKTGSKSCSSALRQLGYTVADYYETVEFLSFVWRDYVEGKATIDDVIGAYDKHGFDANQDIPGSLLWEDLYRALIRRDKNTKVILTVRDSDEAWWASWCRYMQQECSRGAIGDFCVSGLMGSLAARGYMGAEFQAMSSVADEVCGAYIEPSIATPGMSVKSVRITKQMIEFMNDFRRSPDSLKMRRKCDRAIWNTIQFTVCTIEGARL